MSTEKDKPSQIFTPEDVKKIADWFKSDEGIKELNEIPKESADFLKFIDDMHSVDPDFLNLQFTI